jgi:hypothetical protein
MSNHRIRIEYAVDQPHCKGQTHAELISCGDGGRDHLQAAFRAFLVAIGYSSRVACDLRLEWREEALPVAEQREELFGLREDLRG